MVGFPLLIKQIANIVTGKFHETGEWCLFSIGDIRVMRVALYTQICLFCFCRYLAYANINILMKSMDANNYKSRI